VVVVVARPHVDLPANPVPLGCVETDSMPVLDTAVPSSVPFPLLVFVVGVAAPHVD
jgi:hypothetical protein